MKFHKMHGLGNDFIVLNNINPEKLDINKLAIKLCDRRLGIGADGILLVLPSSKADIRMRIINSDGSEADMCGNGIRCFAKYVYENGIINSLKFTVETFAGIIIPELLLKNGIVEAVKVDMGAPKLNRSAIPMLGAESNVINESLAIAKGTVNISSMLMGVPHTMVFTEDVNSYDIDTIGKQIENHPSFTERTNVNFVQVVNKNEIKVRTWERGAGSTLACGTGCCASVIASALNNKTEKTVTVHLAVGDLKIEWTDETVFMTGSATDVFSGELFI